MEAYKQIIEQLIAAQVINDKHKFSAKSRNALKNNPMLNKQVYDLTSFADQEDDYQIRIMYILNSLTSVPKCKTCGCKVGPSQVYALRGKFAEYCSRKCVNYEANHEKTKTTLKEKYGTTNAMNLSENVEKRKQTNRERYGADYAQQTQAGKDKITKTMQERYGVDRPTQRQDFKDKSIQTNIERYGVSNPMMHPDFIEKRKQTNIERYGTETPASTEEVKNKIKQTNMERYGVECTFSSPEIQQKIKQTNMERYGVDNPMKQHQHPETIALLNNAAWLKKMHHEHQWSHAKIAQEIDSTQPCVSRHFAKHGIEVKYFTSSQGERDVNDFVNSLSIPTVQNSRAIIPPFELDIYVPSHFLAIEYNGLFWHSMDNGRDSTYHLNKTIQCESKGIRLLQILESEWIEKNQIVKNYIRGALDVLPHLELEQCVPVEVTIDTAVQFFDDNHIDGYQSASITIGLVSDGELVYAMSFDRRDDLWQIVQFCNNGKVLVHLAVEYLINTFKRELGVENLIYFMDRRWESFEDFADGSFDEIKTIEPQPIESTGIYDCGFCVLLF